MDIENHVSSSGDFYYYNNQQVSEPEGVESFSTAYGEVDKVLLYSAIDDNVKNVSLWENFDDSDVIGMSLSEAFEFLGQ